jgi:hypothetical protein
MFLGYIVTAILYLQFMVHVTLCYYYYYYYYYYYHHHHHHRFHITKPTRCTNFWNLFLEITSTCFRHFLCPSSGVCWQLASKLSANLYDMLLLYVQWKAPDDGQRNCLKHIEFCSKNKFEKLVHLVGFIIRIFRDARSPERQNHHQYQTFTQDVWVLSSLPISHSHLHTHSFDRREFKEGLRKLRKLISTEWDEISSSCTFSYITMIFVRCCWGT